MRTAVPWRPIRALTPIGQRRAKAAWHETRTRARGRFICATSDKLPPGYRKVTDAARIIALLAVLRPARADAARNHDLIAAALVSLIVHAPNGRACGSHQLIGELAGGLARATVGRYLRAWQAAGVLRVVRRGSSAAINGLGRNIAPVYVIAEPEPTEPDALSPEEQAAFDALAARLAGSEHHPVGLGLKGLGVEESLCHIGGKKSPARRRHPERYAPRNAGQRRMAVAWLAARLHLEHEHFGEAIRGAASAFFAAGWCPEAIVWAATTAPDGTPDLTLLREAVWPAKVLNHRLSRWRRCDRTPVAPPVPARTPRRGPQRWTPDDIVQPDQLAPLYPPRQRGPEAEAEVRAALAKIKRDSEARETPVRPRTHSRSGIHRGMNTGSAASPHLGHGGEPR